MSSLTALDQRWWGGEPIWVTARLRSLRSASVFWPGSEVPIGGIWPNYWTKFDDSMPNVDRVNHALDLLTLPEGERPSVITLYFSEADHVGHDDGPESPEMSDAIRHLDASLGLLDAGLPSSCTCSIATIVVVSDHGMTPSATSASSFSTTTSTCRAWTSSTGARPCRCGRGRARLPTYRALKDKHPAMTVYRREEMRRLHYRDNSRIQPIIARSRRLGNHVA